MYKFQVKSLRPSPFSVVARLPDVYKRFLEELKKPASAVHYIPDNRKWCINYEMIQRSENFPIPLKFPKQADEGIWGGEAVVQGFRRMKPKKRRYPTLWLPNLKRSVLYSEILNQYMSVTVTERTLQLIDKHCGFDNYILESPVQDLKSQLALDLRRIMLLALLDREKYHDDDTKQELVWNKYKKFEIPREEAEWFGLSMRDAVVKQKLLENAVQTVPLKVMYRENLIQDLKDGKYEKISKEVKSKTLSWTQKIPFIRRKAT